MTSKTNQARAKRGEELLRQHDRILDPTYDPDEPSPGTLASALADLMHWALVEDIDFDGALDAARDHYKEELAGCDDYLDEEKGDE